MYYIPKTEYWRSALGEVLVGHTMEHLKPITSVALWNLKGEYKGTYNTQIVDELNREYFKTEEEYLMFKMLYPTVDI